MAEKCLYEIRPKRPIPVPGKSPIRTPRTVMLSKKDVLFYMGYGPVYRKFPDDGEPVQVTGNNLDLLHVKKRGQLEKVEPIKEPISTIIPAAPEPVSKTSGQDRGKVAIPTVEPKNNTNTGAFSNYHSSDNKSQK